MSYTNQRPFIGAYFLTKEDEDKAHADLERNLAARDAARNPQPKPAPAPSRIKAGFLKLITKVHPDEGEAHAILGRARAAREAGEALQAEFEARVAGLAHPHRLLLEFRASLASAEGITKPAEEAIINAYIQGANPHITSLANQLVMTERIIPILKAEVEKRTADFNAQLKAAIEWGTANGASKDAIAEIRETFAV